MTLSICGKGAAAAALLVLSACADFVPSFTVSSGVCVVDQVLAPGESCRVPGAGVFRLRDDGCVDEYPSYTGSDGRTAMEYRISEGLDGTVTRVECMAQYVEIDGFRASEIEGSAKIDLMSEFSLFDFDNPDEFDKALAEARARNETLPDFPSWTIESVPGAP